MTRLQITLIAVVGVLIVGALFYFGAKQMSVVGSNGVPDPGKEIREKYAQKQTGGFVISSHGLPAKDVVTKPTPRPTNTYSPTSITPTPVTKSYSTSSQTPTPTPTPFPTTSSYTTPTSSPLSVVENPTPTSVGGNNSDQLNSVLPPDSFQTKPTEAPQELPPINPPQQSTPVPTLNTAPIDTSTNLPSIPPGLIDQRPPEIPQVPTLPPTPPPQIVTASKRYLFNNLTDSALAAKNIVENSPTNKEASYSLKTFAPMGEDIQVALLNNVAGNDYEVPVAAGVWKPFYFQGHKILETGDKLIGSAASGRKRDRLQITFKKIIFKSGKSIPLDAIALDPDGTAGVKGYEVGDKLLQVLAPALLKAASDLGQTFQSNVTTISQNPLTGGVTTNSVINSSDIQTKAAQAVSDITQKISEELSQEVDENKPYILVPAGTLARARLMSPLDTSGADYGK
jgi:hypothetical protein